MMAEYLRRRDDRIVASLIKRDEMLLTRQQRIEELEKRITEALIALQDPPQITTAIAALEKKT